MKVSKYDGDKTLNYTSFKTEAASRLNHTFDFIPNNYTEFSNDETKIAFNNIAMNMDEEVEELPDV